MSKISTIPLSIVMLAASFLVAICSTSPNPPPTQENRHKTDRIGPLVGTVATTARRIAVTAITYHALITSIPIYAPNHTTQLCPSWQNLNPALFSWSTTSTTALGMIFLGAWIRLSAYGGLGRNFTFRLAAPDHLVTSGVYGYMQHPSYTGQMLITVGCAMLFMRWDGALACWVSGLALARVDGWGVTVSAGLVSFAVVVLGARVRDEEEMLREKFGGRWEEWHRSTSRFVPGVF